MAALRGSSFLAFLAWALLSLFFPKAEGAEANGPCEQHLRYRQRTSEPAGGSWGPTVAVFGSACVIWITVVYGLPCICATKDPCALEKSELEWGSPESCTDTNETRATTCGPPALACSRTRRRPCSPMCLEAQQAYSQQLTCMEKRLEGFLCEVRSRRQALENVLGEDVGPLNLDWTSDKLCITVYEIADCEGPRRVQ